MAAPPEAIGRTPGGHWPHSLRLSVAGGALRSEETPRDDARATRLQGAESAESYRERVMYVADLIAGGDWYGRPTAKRLGALGGVDAESVRNYARAAAIVCEDDHGAIQQHRQESLGRWLALHEATMAGEEPDLRAAAAALAGYDRAAGVVEPGGPKVQVNVLQSPGVPELTRSLQAVVVTLIRMAARVEAERLGGLYRAWLEALDAGDAVASRDPAAWLEERARVVEAPLLPRREG